MNMRKSVRNLALRLFEAGALQRKPEGGPTWNLRSVAHPKRGPVVLDLVQLAGFVLWEHAHEKFGHDYQYVVGLPHAGEPFADALVYAHRTVGQSVSLINMRKENRQGRWYMGELENHPSFGDVLVVDDMIAQASTKLQGIAVLREYGLNVAGVLVLLDRQQGGSELLRQAGIRVHALYSQDQLLDLYISEGCITPSVQDKLLGCTVA